MHISVRQLAEDPWEFKVVVSNEDVEVGEYEVVMNEDEFERYGFDAEPLELVKATFKYLLDQEEPDMIQENFKLGEVEKFFPEYPEKIVDYL